MTGTGFVVKHPDTSVNQQNNLQHSLFSQQSRADGIRDTFQQDKQLKPNKKRAIWLYLSAFGAALVLVWLCAPLFAAWFSQDTFVSRSTLRFASVGRGPLIRDVAVQGSIVAADSPTLFAPSNGQLTLMVEAGEPVKAGDLLARLQSPELRNRFAQEQSSLASMDTALKRLALQNRRQQLLNKQRVDLAALNLQSAQREFERAQQSWQQRLISEQSFAAAQDNYQRAQVETRHIESESRLNNESLQFDLQAQQQERQRQALQVKDLQRQLAALDIISPVTGMVGELLTQQQARVEANAPLLSVVDLSVLEVDARVAENYSGQLRVGMVAQLQLPGANYPAFIRNIAPQVEGGQIALRLRFKNAMPPGLRQNQRLSGRIIMQQIASTLRVERGGFLQADGGNFAYKVQGEKAQRVPIRIGATSINYIEILAGLTEGDTIIVSNTQAFDAAQSLHLIDY
ncbi:MAG: efflux RND transporter periplasmic adaptor subunit [Cellvibrionaceae bacterium]|nr:efflux RND transporter periplasmic adaptor subunit [Cellvibrionaceae bacterium]